jgi:hypothetical protein
MRRFLKFKRAIYYFTSLNQSVDLMCGDVKLLSQIFSRNPTDGRTQYFFSTSVVEKLIYRFVCSFKPTVYLFRYNLMFPSFPYSLLSFTHIFRCLLAIPQTSPLNKRSISSSVEIIDSPAFWCSQRLGTDRAQCCLVVICVVLCSVRV